jgi:hypothetical protein
MNTEVQLGYMVAFDIMILNEAKCDAIRQQLSMHINVERIFGRKHVVKDKDNMHSIPW